MSEFATPGMRELYRNMEQLGPRIRGNIVRGMVYAAARETRDAMREATPTGHGELRKQEEKQGRKHGNLRKSIYAKRMRAPRGYFKKMVGAGVGIKRRAFYWRFVEYGHGGPSPAPPHPFLRPTWDAVKHRLVQRMLEYGRQRFSDAVKGP